MFLASRIMLCNALYGLRLKFTWELTELRSDGK